jgi:glycosyltransferase involved in cell wall biosynthesis
MSDRTVLIATGIYPPDIGGPATYAKTLVEELPKRGIRPLLLNFSPLTRFPSGLRHLIFMLQVLRAGPRADVIYALDPVSAGLPAYIAARLLRKRFVLRVGGDFAWEQAVAHQGSTADMLEFQAGRHSRKIRTLRAVESYVARHADRTIVPSKFMKQIVEGWGVAGLVVLVYNACNVPRVLLPHPKQSEVVGRAGGLIVTAGRLLRWKGFGGIIEAMALLAGKSPGLRLVIIGVGPMHGELERLIADRHLRAAVSLVGRLSRAETLAWLSVADLFVLNSRAEGLSHLILESMGVGTPVVATRAGGNPELVEHGASGLLVPPDDPRQLADAMQKILADATLRKRMGDKARRAARQFTVDRMVDESIVGIFGDT